MTECDFVLIIAKGKDMADDKAPTILFVDDEKRLWAAYEGFFSEYGYTCRFAEDGCAAVTAVREEAIDLVVMDLNMPHVDGELGIEVIKEIKPEIPIFVVSGFITPDQIEEGIPGANRVFLKPASMPKLKEAIEQELGLSGQSS